MRGFSIPSPIVQKNALFKSLKDELYEIFTKYSSLYDGRKSEYEYDVRVFTDKLVKSTEEVLTSTGKSNPNATSSGNKFTYSIDLQEIIERFQTYPIDSFHSELMKMIDNLKEKVRKLLLTVSDLVLSYISKRPSVLLTYISAGQSQFMDKLFLWRNWESIV